MSLARVCLSSQKLLAHRNIISITSQLRSVTTTRKNSDCQPKCTAGTGEVKKPWVTYGFDTASDSQDKLNTHLGFFFGFTLCAVGGVFFLSYAPQDTDWVSREAYLELRRREEAGLPLIDKNYIDVSMLDLPSDEELGATEIII